MCWGVEKGIGECVRMREEVRGDVGKCDGVWGGVKGDARKGVGRSVEDVTKCEGCGKVC